MGTHSAASLVRRSGTAVIEAFLILAIVVSLAVSWAIATGHPVTVSRALAAGRMGTLAVSFDGSPATTTTASLTSSNGSSIFTGHGCNFRANDAGYYMVVKGPGADTTSVSYWVDPFPTNGSGCGSSTVSWTGSGVAGTFEVYVVRSPSGNPWQAQPASNQVTINIANS